jgi:hypothetical protein
MFITFNQNAELQRMDKIKNESRSIRETVSVKKKTVILAITEKETCADTDVLYSE